MQTKRCHILIDLSNLPPKPLSDATGLENFLHNLAETVEMRILHGPVVVEGIPANPGLTGFAIVDFSHLSVHTFSTANEALVDIFSCKSYDQEAAIAATLVYFEAERSQARLEVVHWDQ